MPRHHASPRPLHRPRGRSSRQTRASSRPSPGEGGYPPLRRLNASPLSRKRPADVRVSTVAARPHRARARDSVNGEDSGFGDVPEALGALEHPQSRVFPHYSVLRVHHEALPHQEALPHHGTRGVTARTQDRRGRAPTPAPAVDHPVERRGSDQQGGGAGAEHEGHHVRASLEAGDGLRSGPGRPAPAGTRTGSAHRSVPPAPLAGSRRTPGRPAAWASRRGPPRSSRRGREAPPVHRR